MNNPDRYRTELIGFHTELREALARVAPDVAESPIGATLLATALVEEAARLMHGQFAEREARTMMEQVVGAQFPGGKAGSSAF